MELASSKQLASKAEFELVAKLGTERGYRGADLLTAISVRNRRLIALEDATDQ